MISLPAMGTAQESAWLSLLDLAERHPHGWTLIGGQMVHLHCAERGYAPQRPTSDADMVVDARVPSVLGSVTSTLVGLGFEPCTPSSDGIQHRWTRGHAVIDVLIPEGAGERTARRPSASGFPTVAAPGGTQALKRSETVEVRVGDRTGTVRRPVLLSAMIMKAAARLETTGPARERHCHDFAALAAVMAAGDTATFALTSKDKQRLRAMITRTRGMPDALDENPMAGRRLDRLEDLISRP